MSGIYAPTLPSVTPRDFGNLKNKRFRKRQRRAMSPMEATPKLSYLHTQQCLYFMATVKNHSTQILLDSGSSGDFVSREFVRAAGLKEHKAKRPMNVQAASGQALYCDTYVRARLRIGSATLRLRLRVLDIAQSIVLGMPFLSKFDPYVSWKSRLMKLRLKKPSVTHVIHYTSALALSLRLTVLEELQTPTPNLLIPDGDSNDCIDSLEYVDLREELPRIQREYDVPAKTKPPCPREEPPA